MIVNWTPVFPAYSTWHACRRWEKHSINFLLVLSHIIYSEVAFYYLYWKKFWEMSSLHFNCFNICFSLGIPEVFHCAECGKALTSYAFPFQHDLPEERKHNGNSDDIPTSQWLLDSGLVIAESSRQTEYFLNGLQILGETVFW